MKLPHISQRRFEIADGHRDRGDSRARNLGEFGDGGSSRQLEEDETVDGDGGEDSVREREDSRREKTGVSTGGEVRRQNRWEFRGRRVREKKV